MPVLEDRTIDNAFLNRRNTSENSALSQIRSEVAEKPVEQKSPFPSPEEAKTYYRNVRQSMGVSPEEIEAEVSGTEEPWIDPITTGGSAAGMTGKMALKAGVPLLRAVGRAATSGIVSGVAEYPIGAATEGIGEISPGLAMPFNMITGMVSGATVENLIEKSVIKALSKAGTKPNPNAIKETIDIVTNNLKTGNVEDDISKEVASDLNSELGLFKTKQGEPVEKAKAAEAQAKEEEVKADGIVEPQGKGEATTLGEMLTSGKGELATSLKKSFGDHSKPLVSFPKQPQAKVESFLKENVNPLPKKAININFSRIETTDDIKEIIEKTARTFKTDINDARRNIQTNEQTEALANDLGLTVQDLLKRRTGQAFNAEEALSARRILVSSAEKLQEMSKAIGTGVASDFDKMSFRKQISLHYAIQAQVSGMTAEAGRALQSFNIMSANMGELKTIFDNMKVFESKNGFSIEDIAQRISTIDTIDGINTAIRQSQRATTTDMLLEAWINGLLSNPVTHAVNTTSNQLVAFWQIPERFLAAGIGKLFGDNEIKAQEALSQTYGMINGLKDSFKMAGKVLITGEPSDPLSKIEVSKYRAISSENLDISGVPGRAVDLLGEIIRVPGRALMAEDEFFKGMGYRMELHARAFRQANGEGLEGKELSLRIQDIINNPPDDIKLASIDAARYQTFTKELGATGKKLQSFFNSQPALKVIAPFFRTPTNIFKFFGERTPLGLLSKNLRMDVAAGGARRDLALSRMSLGSAVMAMSAYYTANGLITGGGPSDSRTKALLRETGWQPYSVKIGDKYYAYGRLEPLGTILGVGADIAEIMGQLDSGDIGFEELPATAIIALSRNVTEKTFLQGITSLVEAVEDPDRYGSRYIQRLTGSVVPSLVAQVNRINDPTLKEVDSILDNIKSRVPGWGKDLPPRRNLWGEPIVLGGSLGPDIVSPIYTSEKKKAPVSEELIRLRIPLSMPEKNIDGVKLTPKEYDRYVVLAGNEVKNPSTGLGLKDTLEDLIKDPEYQRQSDGPDGGKALLIRSNVHIFRELAKLQLFDENEELANLVNEEKVNRAMQQMPLF